MPSFINCNSRNLYSLGLIAVLLRMALIPHINILLCGIGDVGRKMWNQETVVQRKEHVGDSTPPFFNDPL